MQAPAKDELEAIKELVAQGDRALAKKRCQAYLQHRPTSEQAMIQLLLLEPTPEEEIAILESFLQHYPDHQRYATHFTERLSKLRIATQSSERSTAAPADRRSTNAVTGPLPIKTAPVRSGQRIGEYLIASQIITPQQLERALEEQQRGLQRGSQQRLGTILLMQGAITTDHFSAALSRQIRQDVAEIGDYLVRVGAITPVQLKNALEIQSQRNVESEQDYQRAVQSAQSPPNADTSNRPAPPPPRRRPVPRLGDILVEQGILDERQLNGYLNDRNRR
ncbi:MAG: hypothetical protein NVS2B7_10890 [Herpetosiphon sp.]